MEEIKIYKEGALIYSAPITDAAERAHALQQYNYVSLDWIAAESKPIPANSYIDFEGTRFFNEDDYRPEREDNYYHYQITFHAIEDTFNRPLFFRYVNITDQSTGEVHTWKEPEFSLNGNLKTIADIIVTSLNMAGYDVYFKLPADNKYKDTELKTYSFASVSIAEAMATVADMNETEWWVESTTEQQEGKPVVLLHFDKCEYGDNIELSDEYYQEGNIWKSKGLRKIDQTSRENIIPSKLYVYGSERNIIKKTVQEMVDGGLMNVSYAKKLRLPEESRAIYSKVLDTRLFVNGGDSSITIEGIDNGFEAAKIFDEIYPKMTMTITKIEVLNPNSDNPIYYLNADKLKSLTTAEPADDAINPGKLGLLIEGTTLMCTFTSGLLNGFEFECAWRESTAQIGLVPNEDEDVQIPFGNFAPNVGDKFILWNLAMPKTAVTDAQQELLTEAVNYIEDLALTIPDTRCATDSEYFHQTGTKIAVGQRYTLYSDIFKGNKLPSRCIQYSYKLTQPYDIDFTIASAIAKGRLAKIENQISDVTAEVDTVGQTQRSISRRQWHDVEEMKQMIDAIQTQMVVVGYEQDAFVFTNVINYDQGTKILKVHKGYLQHQVYTENAWKGVWLVADNFQQDMSVIDPDGTTPYYIYIRCSKSADTASIQLSDLSINYDQPDSYYFLAGILSSEFEGNRVFNQTSGLTSIAGGTITTEVIQDAARKLIVDFSNQRIIARDGAEIVGKIKYTSADGSIKDIDEIENKIDNIKVVGINLAIYSTCKVDGIDKTDGKFILKSGTPTALSVVSEIGGSAVERLIRITDLTEGSKTYTLNPILPFEDIKILFVDNGGNILGSIVFKNEQFSTDKTYQLSFNIIEKGTGLKYIKIEEGTISSSWTPAPEDQIRAEYNRLTDTYKYIFEQDNLTPSIYKLRPTVALKKDTNYLFSVEKITWEPAQVGNKQGDKYEIGIVNNEIYTKIAESYYNEEQHINLKMPTNVDDNTLFALKFNPDSQAGKGKVIFEKFKLAEGNMYTGWTAASTEEYDSLRLVSGAIEDGTTEVNGGMIMTNVLMLKDLSGNIQAGMSGITKYKGIEDKVLLWGGGSYTTAQLATAGGTDLPVLLTKSGYGSNIGCLEITENKDVVVNCIDGRKILLSQKPSADIGLPETVVLQGHSIDSKTGSAWSGDLVLDTDKFRDKNQYKLNVKKAGLTLRISDYTLKAQGAYVELYFAVTIRYSNSTQLLLSDYIHHEYGQGNNNYGLTKGFVIEGIKDHLRESAKAGEKVDLIFHYEFTTFGAVDGIPNVHGNAMPIYADFEELGAMTAICSDGIVVCQGSHNVFAIESDKKKNDIQMKFRGTIGGIQEGYAKSGRIYVDLDGFLRIKEDDESAEV